MTLINNITRKVSSSPSSPYALATAKVALLVCVMVVPFWSTWTGLANEWFKWDEATGHGSLMALATVYFLFHTATKAYTSEDTAQKVYAGLPLVVVFALLATLSQRVGLDAITQLALVGLLLGLTLVFFPNAPWLRLFQVSGLLIFCIQAWGSLNSMLLWTASGVVGSAVGWMSIPTLIDGNSITLPHGIMMIADGCSGLRYFIVALALGWILSINNQYGLKAIVATMIAAAVLALLMNWLRIYILILVGYYSEMQHSLVQDHELFGWILFGMMVLPVMYFAPQGPKQVRKVQS